MELNIHRFKSYVDLLKEHDYKIFLKVYLPLVPFVFAHFHNASIQHSRTLFQIAYNFWCQHYGSEMNYSQIKKRN